MIMSKRSRVFVLSVAALSVLFILIAREYVVCQEIIQDEVYYNEQGLNYFNQGYYKLLPQGRTQEADQMLEQAIVSFRQAIAIKENYADAHRNLARVYYVQKRFTEAAWEYERLIELTPGDVDAYVKLASAYTKLNKYSEAIDVLEEAKKITNEERVVILLNEFIQRLQHDD
jgi:tetratricopeptide (TPR) repeat protein